MKTYNNVYDARKHAERKTTENFGYELEILYARILCGRVNPHGKDCGRDIEFPDPTSPTRTVGVQIKTTYHPGEVLHFLGIALRGALQHGRTWTNFCFGEPPDGSDSEAQTIILGYFEKHGAWVEQDEPRRTDILSILQRVREQFPQDKVQRVFLVKPVNAYTHF